MVYRTAFQIRMLTVGGQLKSDLIAPEITAEPQSSTVNQGDVFSFSVTATGSTPLAYQWFKNGSAISGATSSTYTATAQIGDNNDVYYCIVSNSLDSVQSENAVLTVNANDASYLLMQSGNRILLQNTNKLILNA